jgi:hypothetical protein
MQLRQELRSSPERSSASNVIRFPGSRAQASPRRDQKSFMDAVYTAGSIPLAADDRATKAMATRLQVFGFVVIDEVQADGSARRLRPSEAVKATLDHPWRVSKPSGRWSVAGATSADDLFQELSLP